MRQADADESFAADGSLEVVVTGLERVKLARRRIEAVGGSAERPPHHLARTVVQAPEDGAIRTSERENVYRRERSEV